MCVVLHLIVPVVRHEVAAFEVEASGRHVGMIAARPAVVLLLLWKRRLVVLLTRA